VSLLGTAIQWAKIPRRMTNSSWVQDRIELRKMVQLCSGCLYKMPWRWERRYHYEPFRAGHGEGTCDGCRGEHILTLYLSTDDPWYAQCEKQARLAQTITDDDRAFAVNDRRRFS